MSDTLSDPHAVITSVPNRSVLKCQRVPHRRHHSTNTLLAKTLHTTTHLDIIRDKVANDSSSSWSGGEIESESIHSSAITEYGQLPRKSVTTLYDASTEGEEWNGKR